MTKDSFLGIDRSVAEPLEFADPEPLTEELLLKCMAAHDRRAAWNAKNPPGSKNNPYIVSPESYAALKAAGFCE